MAKCAYLYDVCTVSDENKDSVLDRILCKLVEAQRELEYHKAQTTIISQELFDAVQKLLSNNAKSTPTGRMYLFNSILICAECGHRLACRFGNKRYYY